MDADTLKRNFRKDFPKNCRELEKLVLLEFKARNPLRNILFIGSDHGDEISGTNALIKKATCLRHKQPTCASIDMVPVVDIDGYYFRRTSLGTSGLGKEKYLDSAYFQESPPEPIKDLKKVLRSKKYDLVCMLNSRFKEDAPLLDGFFIEPQIDITGGMLNFGFPEASDIMGFILYSLKKQGRRILRSHKQGYLGGGYSLFREGIVIPGREENRRIVWENILGFNRYCMENSINSMVLTTVSSGVDKTFQDKSVKDHEATVNAAITFYNSLKS